MRFLLKKHCCPEQNDRGFALIATLGIMSVLAVLSWSFVFNARAEIKITSWQRHALDAYYVARAGMQRTGAILAAHGEEKANGPGSPWWSNEALYRNVRLKNGEYTIRPFAGNAAGQNGSYGVVDEESFLNINTATPEMLVRFEGITNVLAEEIIIYRARLTTEDNAPQQNAATVSGPVCEISELLQIPGLTKEILFGGSDGATRLGNNATCYSSGKINVNTARPAVLSSLGLSEEEVQSILQFRAEGQNAESVETFLEQVGLKKDRLKNNASLLIVKSTHFRMASTATILKNVSELTVSGRCDVLKGTAGFSSWQVAYTGVAP